MPHPKRQPARLWRVSPSRAIARRLRGSYIYDFCSVIRWNLIFYGLELGVAVELFDKPGLILRVAMVAFVYLLFSRIMELAIAFYRDAFIRPFNFYYKDLSINPPERIVLLSLAYAEIIVAFGLAYKALSVGLNTLSLEHASDLFDYIFFSAITITTTGYGDVYPAIWESKLLAMIEAITGIVFIAMALSGYLTRQDKTDRANQKLSSCFRGKRPPRFTQSSNQALPETD